jgi:hypothetical protein
MKKIDLKYMAIFLLGLFTLVSCKKSFLETTPKGEFLQANYYSTPDEAFAGLTAAYDPLVTETGGLDGTYTDPRGPLNSASDDCYAGGGGSGDVPDWQLFNNYQFTSGSGPQQGFWPINFLGVSRANTILNVLQTTSIAGLSDATKNRYIAEATFLRAHYNFDLLRLFKNIPLITKPVAATDIYALTQAAPDAVFASIEADLQAAIPNLPATVSGSELGRVTQGAAIALLGKVYLYNKKYTQAATELAKVNGAPGSTTAIYGYHLQANFGQIFNPDNKFNSESIFEWNFSPNQAYTWNNWNTFKGDIYTQMIGPRDYADAVYAGGWGFNPVTKQLVNAFTAPYDGSGVKDPRYGYTILNMDSLAAARSATYSPSYQNTGYFTLKYAPLTKYIPTQGTSTLNFPNNYIEIRLADTYLMEAEALLQGGGDAARAAALLNAVRARVGLAPVAATMANIKAERRLELATEGHRWFDLVRWGDAASTLAFKGFTANKNELLPIPLTDLANTKLVQNPGYAK